ncbi:M14 family metallopeptidase [Microbulbifer halophilus]|uniref:M14 metallopeptidase family protein n=1 Tax=Microbulbifer halophilus TaxID=453963 RepID=A0ABW5EAN2_9GAMM|nr:M14 metallopeptidase family protein [Microbulbifer halophilus]MCW8127122.1 M14 family metallopeptidase [Microbulbifer halophilus]
MHQRRIALSSFFLLLLSGNALAMADPQTYADYRQPGLDKPSIRQADMLPLIDRWQSSPLLDVREIARSYEGRPIYRIGIGRGDTRVMLWSQMHGDEPTATAALFDLLNYITAPEQADWRAGWMDKLSLVIVPMLNPDGAERDIRHNAQSFDVNRDAKALQSPEGRALMAQARSFKPHFGFNLHDQNRHYGVGDSGRMATISVLAPPFNEAREVNDSRRYAMQLIGALAGVVEPVIGGHLARYDDTYAYRAFGDTFSEMGISTILIESGAHPDDPNRQVARRMNFEMLVAAIDNIASGSYREIPEAAYREIPLNRDDAIVDVKIRGMKTLDGDAGYMTDLAINRRGDTASVIDVGDLSNLHGAFSFDASDWQYVAPEGFQLEEGEKLVLDDARYLELLRQGYGYFVGDSDDIRIDTDWPVVINPAQPQSEIPQRRRGATFLLRDGEGIGAAVLNGHLVELRSLLAPKG